MCEIVSNSDVDVDFDFEAQREIFTKAGPEVCWLISDDVLPEG